MQHISLYVDRQGWNVQTNNILSKFTTLQLAIYISFWREDDKTNTAPEPPSPVTRHHHYDDHHHPHYTCM